MPENKFCPLLLAGAIGSMFNRELDSVNPMLEKDTLPYTLCLKDKCEWWIPGDKPGCSVKKNRK